MNLLLIVSNCLEYANAFTDMSDSSKAEVFIDKLEDEGYSIRAYAKEYIHET